MRAIKIYAISLKRLPERRKFMEAQLSALGLEAEFVEGVDGLELSEETIKTNGGLSPTEIGCAWSHRNVYKRLIDSEEEYALVLEDDAVLTPEIVHFLEIMPEIVSDWELISLFWLNRNRTRSYIFRSSFPLNLYNQHKLELGSPPRKYRLGELLLPVFGAVAYVVSRQGAHLFTRHNTPDNQLVRSYICQCHSGEVVSGKTELSFTQMARLRHYNSFSLQPIEKPTKPLDITSSLYKILSIETGRSHRKQTKTTL